MSSGFDVIRRHARDATSVRIKELAQQLAKARSDISGSQLETDDVRSEGRMDHSTIKLNDERLKFITLLDAANTDFFYEFCNEPDLNHLKVWFMLDHLGSKMRDMSCLGNDAFIAGHPTLRRVGLDLGFQQTSSNGGGGLSATPVMLFNSGTDVVSQRNGEYIWIPDNPSIQFTQFSAGFSICFRFNCLDFNPHVSLEGGSFLRRFAVKTDNATNGWSLIVNSANSAGTQGIIEFEIKHNNVNYARFYNGLLLANTWYQVVVTYNPNVTENERIKIYIAGTELSAPGTFSTILPTHPNLRIGARDAETGFFHGYIHDFRLYMGKVLNQTEITNINQNELTIDSVSKGHVFVVQYALVSTPRRTRTHKYHMTGRVKKSRVHKYNLIKKLTKTKTHKYNLLQRLASAKTKTHKFNILQKVTRTRTHKYNMGGELTVNKTHKFNILNKITKTKTHKYNLGGLRTQYQRFQKSTTAGSNVVQEITFTSTPQALIVWSDGNTQDNTFANAVGLYHGFSDGVHHACVSGLSKDSQDTSDTFSGQKDNRVISLMDNTVGSMVAEATVSFSANKAIFNWTTNDNRAVYIHCLALWGINKAEVKTFTAGTTNTGNRTYSLNDSSMTPTFIHTITVSEDQSGFWSTAQGQAICIGAGKSSSKQFSVANINEDAQATSDVWTEYHTNAVVVGYDDDDGTIEQSASLVSFGAGTFTLSWNNPPPTTNRAFAVLALDSPNTDVGIITQPTSTGTQVVSTDTNVDTVKGLMIFSNAQTTGTKQSTMQLSIGGASGTGSTDQGVVTVGENDNVGTTETARINKTGSIIKTISVNGTVASSTTTSEAAVSALGTDQFSLNWTTANATQRKSHYMVFGS